MTRRRDDDDDTNITRMMMIRQWEQWNSDTETMKTKRCRWLDYSDERLSSSTTRQWQWCRDDDDW